MACKRCEAMREAMKRLLEKIGDVIDGKDVEEEKPEGEKK